MLCLTISALSPQHRPPEGHCARRDGQTSSVRKTLYSREDLLAGFGLNFPSGIGAEPGNSSEGQAGGTTITVTGAAAAGATIGAIVGAAVGNPLAGAVIGAAIGALVGGIASLFEDLGLRLL